MQIFENCIQSSVHQCMYKNAMNPKTSIPSNNAWCDRRSKSKQIHKWTLKLLKRSSTVWVVL